MPLSSAVVENEPSLQTLWHRLLGNLREEGHAYAASQLAQLLPLSQAPGLVRLGVADRFFRDWIDDHYRPLLEKSLSTLLTQASKVEFEIVEFQQPAAANFPTAPLKNTHLNSKLNTRFTFEAYVVADSNELPAAAAAAVADEPGQYYNPLFIYGGTGLGKTHLLHAIGNRVLEGNPAARVVYLSSEEFTNRFIESVRDHRMTEFRRKFREECDLLLIDDIQFLGKKQETQNEFFYTFNALHQVSKAIVLTSDTAPSEIPGLEERLRSRFTMGLITDVQEPNFEMRVAILKKKAGADGFDLPDKVAHFIARHVLRNVRELEGALIKLCAVHSLTRQPMTEEFAAQVLKDILPAKEQLDVDNIQREVARFFKLNADELRGASRVKHIAYARQVAMYLCRAHTRASLPELGQKFNKDHSTVLASVRKIELVQEKDESLRKDLAELRARLGVEVP